MKVENIDINRIKPNPNQPRKYFDSDKMSELMLSVTAQELINPITVRSDNNGGYEIISGERRYRATKNLGHKDIDCIVKEVDDKKAYGQSVISNEVRVKVPDIQSEDSIEKMYDTGDYASATDLSQKTGIPKTSVIRLLKAYRGRIDSNITENTSKKISSNVG